MVEVRYAGISVGRSTIVRDHDANGLFLGISDPMPVGTLVTLKIGDDLFAARVEEVCESGELAKVGMKIALRGPASELSGATIVPAPLTASGPVPIASSLAGGSGPATGSGAATARETEDRSSDRGGVVVDSSARAEGSGATARSGPINPTDPVVRRKTETIAAESAKNDSAASPAPSAPSDDRIPAPAILADAAAAAKRGKKSRRR